jgi:hypothetical protein
MNTTSYETDALTPDEALSMMMAHADQRIAEMRAREEAARQRLINRENARKSTGPRTEAGKAASSQNRLSHGLCSSRLLVFGETQAEFDALEAEVLATFAPVTPEETFLVQQLTVALWRFNRARRVEAKTFDYMMELTDQTLSENGAFETDQETEAQLGASVIDAVNQKSFATLQRYVTAAERSYRQALKDVQAAIKRRKPEPQAIAVPVVVPAEKPKAAAAGQILYPEVEPSVLPSAPVTAPAYVDRC